MLKVANIIARRKNLSYCWARTHVSKPIFSAVPKTLTTRPLGANCAELKFAENYSYIVQFNFQFSFVLRRLVLNVCRRPHPDFIIHSIWKTWRKSAAECWWYTVVCSSYRSNWCACGAMNLVALFAIDSLPNRYTQFKHLCDDSYSIWMISPPKKMYYIGRWNDAKISCGGDKNEFRCSTKTNSSEDQTWFSWKHRSNRNDGR